MIATATMRRVWGGLVLALALPAWAQESTSYRLVARGINGGGHPAQGVVMSSASFIISIDALADPVAGLVLQGPSFRLNGGTLGGATPPGEVTGILFLADGSTLQWLPEPAAGTYNLYRGLLSARSATNHGACLEPGIAGTTTADAATPPLGDGHFFHITVENSFAEEGTLGYDDALVERPNGSPCP